MFQSGPEGGPTTAFIFHINPLVTARLQLFLQLASQSIAEKQPGQFELLEEISALPLPHPSAPSSTLRSCQRHYEAKIGTEFRGY